MILFSSCGSDLSDADKLKKYKYHVSKADSLFAIKKYKDAVIQGDSAIKITDTLANAFYSRGVANFELNLLDNAKEDFSQVIDIEGEKSRAYRNRAMVYLKLNDSDFISDIDKYLLVYANDEESRQLKVKFSEQKGDLSTAVKEYSLLIAKDSTKIDLYRKRGELYEKQKDYKQALADYRTIIRLSPNHSDVKQKIIDLEKVNLIKKKNDLLVGYFILSYLVYLVLSSVIIRPLVKRKAKNHVGGNFIVGKDPLVWLLPFIFAFIYFLYYKNIINLNFMLNV